MLSPLKKCGDDSASIAEQIARANIVLHTSCPWGVKVNAENMIAGTAARAAPALVSAQVRHASFIPEWLR